LLSDFTNQVTKIHSNPLHASHPRITNILSKQKRSSTSKDIAFRTTKQSTIVKVLLAVININTLVVIRRASTMRSNMRAVHFRPNTREDQMNRSADDVIAPSLVETAERLELKPPNTVELVGVLLVWSCTLFLNRWAESYLCDLLDRKVPNVMSNRSVDPGL
jgi:hypothetical protein